MRFQSRRLLVGALVGLIGGGALAGVGLARQRAAAGMAKAANDFLASLTPEQRPKAAQPMPSADCVKATAESTCEWTRWHFIPASMFARNGLGLKDMTEVQRQRAHDLMRASLSQRGYQTASAIIQLEIILRETEGAARGAAAGGAAPAGQPAPAAPPAPAAQPAPAPAPAPAAGQAAAQPAGAQPARGGRGGGGGGGPVIRDPELYYFTVFGDPSSKTAWGWRVEGHHVSLRFAVDNGKMTATSTPQFLGSNPAEVRQGPQAGLRVLATQEDTGRALVQSLAAAEQAIAIVGPKARGDIATGTALKVDLLNPAGLSAERMTAAQRDMLMKIIDSYASIMPADVAADRMARIKAAGTDKITFAWAGPTDKGMQYHYQVQGPTFLIEHNNTQNNGNHIHSVWRDFNGDFGRDVLADHMAALPH